MNPYLGYTEGQTAAILIEHAELQRAWEQATSIATSLHARPIEAIQRAEQLFHHNARNLLEKEWGPEVVSAYDDAAECIREDRVYDGARYIIEAERMAIEMDERLTKAGQRWVELAEKIGAYQALDAFARWEVDVKTLERARDIVSAQGNTALASELVQQRIAMLEAG